jgi:hypothetical protein
MSFTSYLGFWAIFKTTLYWRGGRPFVFMVQRGLDSTVGAALSLERNDHFHTHQWDISLRKGRYWRTSFAISQPVLRRLNCLSTCNLEDSFSLVDHMWSAALVCGKVNSVLSCSWLWIQWSCVELSLMH